MWSRTKTTVVVSVGLLLVVGIAAILFSLFRDPQKVAIAKGRRTIAKHLATPVDLTANYTTPASYFDKIASVPAWKTVPTGFHVFDDIPLQIDGMICLWGEANAQRGLVFPEAITGIKVEPKFETLYVYHGSFYESPADTPVCEVVFHYEDGSSETTQLLYGVDVLDWIQNSRSKVISGPTGPHTKLAWVGGEVSPKRKQPLRFCLTAIQNPYPASEVTSIELRSSKSRTAACIMAMTTGKSGLMTDQFTDERKK